MQVQNPLAIAGPSSRKVPTDIQKEDIACVERGHPAEGGRLLDKKEPVTPGKEAIAKDNLEARWLIGSLVNYEESCLNLAPSLSAGFFPHQNKAHPSPILLASSLFSHTHSSNRIFSGQSNVRFPLFPRLSSTAQTSPEPKFAYLANTVKMSKAGGS